jgi:hypothetical protein
MKCERIKDRRPFGDFLAREGVLQKAFSAKRTLNVAFLN